MTLHTQLFCAALLQFRSYLYKICARDCVAVTISRDGASCLVWLLRRVQRIVAVRSTERCSLPAETSVRQAQSKAACTSGMFDRRHRAESAHENGLSHERALCRRRTFEEWKKKAQEMNMSA